MPLLMEPPSRWINHLALALTPKPCVQLPVVTIFVTKKNCSGVVAVVYFRTCIVACYGFFDVHV